MNKKWWFFFKNHQNNGKYIRKPQKVGCKKK